MSAILAGEHPKWPGRGDCDWAPIPQSLWALMVRCWNPQPELRPKMHYIARQFSETSALDIQPLQPKIFYLGSPFHFYIASRIRCLLHIPGTNFILVGHEDGLSVLNLRPESDHDNRRGRNALANVQLGEIWRGLA
jgi:hypothetical protein